MVSEGRAYLPPRVKAVDMKSPTQEKPQYIRELEEEADAAKLYRRISEERRLNEQLNAPPQIESPVQVRGSINLGDFNMQEQQRIAQQEAALYRKDAEDRLDKLRGDLASTQSLLHQAQLDTVKQGLETRINQLTEMLQRGQAKEPNFLEQLATIEAMAEKLGFSKVGSVEGTSLKDQIALKQLEAEMKREERKFLLQMEADKREWQLEIRKLDQQNIAEQERRKNEEMKWMQLASIPQQFGSAFAKGIMARGDGMPQPVGAPVQTAPPPGRKLEVGVGEYAEFNCATCQTVVGLGPTSQQTACARCGTIYDIIRVPVEQPMNNSQVQQEVEEEHYHQWA